MVPDTVVASLQCFKPSPGPYQAPIPWEVDVEVLRAAFNLLVQLLHEVVGLSALNLTAQPKLQARLYVPLGPINHDNPDPTPAP